MERVKRVPVRRVEGGDVESVDDVAVVERAASIEIEGTLRLATVCSPGELGEWVIGYLYTEGLIGSPEDVEGITHVGGSYSVRLRTTAPIEPPSSVSSDLVLGTDRLLEAASELVERASTFKETGGTHVAAIADRTEILTLAEDISRTCALEKAIGEAVLTGVDFGRSFALLSSRVPARMIAKLARCGVPIVAAVSAPSADAIELAEELRICLCGFVRDERMNVYSHVWRVGL
jgi:FdhD protein